MDIELYTDGGCRENGQSQNAPGGIGCVLLIPDKQPIYLKEKLKFQPNTNNKAEIYAVIRGLDMLYKNYCFQTGFVKDKLTIYSDSAYMINGITNVFFFSLITISNALLVCSKRIDIGIS